MNNKSFIDLISRHNRVKNLTRLDASHTQVTTEGLNKFVAKSSHKLKVYGKTVERRQSSRSSGSKKEKEKKH